MTTPPKTPTYKTSPAEAERDSKFRTVFVSGLSYSTTEEDVTRFFSTCAPIEYFSINVKINTNID
jgi:RNA recognition motif-containing protein